MISCGNSSKSLQKKSVLRELNMELHEGSIFGLVGVNGAGKTTLLRSIAGVYQPDSGTITLNDVNIHAHSEMRKKIAFVPDEPYIPYGSTIDSLSMIYRNLYSFSESDYKHYMQLLELEPGMPAGNLSKGMKRRVSILFALSFQPDLILLDEAYDGLEPLARLRFKKILAELIEDRKTLLS